MRDAADLRAVMDLWAVTDFRAAAASLPVMGELPEILFPPGRRGSFGEIRAIPEQSRAILEQSRAALDAGAGDLAFGFPMWLHGNPLFSPCEALFFAPLKRGEFTLRKQFGSIFQTPAR